MCLGTGESLSEVGGSVDGDSSDIKLPWRIIPKSEES